jgi:hypothetical protein
MKTTAANPNATTQRQSRDSRQNTETGAATQKSSPTNAASSSQRATERAKRGEPLSAASRKDRSPKQENL